MLEALRIGPQRETCSQLPKGMPAIGDKHLPNTLNIRLLLILGR